MENLIITIISAISVLVVIVSLDSLFVKTKKLESEISELKKEIFGEEMEEMEESRSQYLLSSSWWFPSRKKGIIEKQKEIENKQEKLIEYLKISYKKPSTKEIKGKYIKAKKK